MNTARIQSATADALESVSKLVDITRNDINSLEHILLIGTNTEKPITSRVALLESKLETLMQSLQNLEKAMETNIGNQKECSKGKNQRLKKLERLAWMISGALFIAGAFVTYLLKWVGLNLGP